MIITGLTLSGGRHAGGGGAVLVTGGHTVTLSGCTFSANHAGDRTWSTKLSLVK